MWLKKFVTSVLVIFVIVLIGAIMIGVGGAVADHQDYQVPYLVQPALADEPLGIQDKVEWQRPLPEITPEHNREKAKDLVNPDGRGRGG